MHCLNLRTVSEKLLSVRGVLFLFALYLFSGCTDQQKTFFTALGPESTGIQFSNDLHYTEDYNPYTYRNFYNGGGVAIGDINNDGLPDLYFAGNLVPNRLYLNKGGLQFEDITEQAGLACTGVWTSGVNFVDINGDGWLDIYVCKAGKPGGPNRHNELFINQGDLTFAEESAAYGLDFTGLSIQSAFFDYDLDGDLDCYLLNNSLRSVGGFDMQEGLRDQYDPEGNKLLENREGVFVDVTREAGIYASRIGYGLGITLADFNQDGWPDIFLSNDFFEKDYLYFNNQDGTFRETSDSSFMALSMGSMGADACDLDNDLLSEIFVTEMLPRAADRKKTKTAYEEWDKYQLSVKKGYHHQFARNVLHKNLNGHQFVELGRMAGVESTDWSWSALLQDYDADGLRDIFVSNGIRSDLLDKDYLNYMANETRVRAMINEDKEVLKKLIDIMPSAPVPNALFRNEGGLQFSYRTRESGFETPTYSNGSAYGDLDNDGDLDLVVNNVDQPATLYRNNTLRSEAHSIAFRLEFKGGNRQAIGTKVLMVSDSLRSLFEYFPTKGFQSSSAVPVFFGLGPRTVVDSVYVIWPNGEVSVKTQLEADRVYDIRYVDAGVVLQPPTLWSAPKPVLRPVAPPVRFEHEEVDLNFFGRERMLLTMPGGKGPVLAKADVNGDGQEDVFVGGGKNQESMLYLATEEGFEPKALFADTRRSEVTDAVFFDSDQDGDLDLYVGHGGKAFSEYTPELNDALYLNDGLGNFQRAAEALDFPAPLSTGAVAIADFDQDGRPDIVVGEAMKTNIYGLPGSCLLWRNKGSNQFERFGAEAGKDLGMITTLAVADIDGNGWTDVLLAGEYMPITVLYNEQSTFRKEVLNGTDGWWQAMEMTDLDQDGDPDFVLGNLGTNNFFREGHMVFVADFDQNGTPEQIACTKTEDGHFPIQDIDELYMQMPVLKKKYRRYEAFSKAPLEALVSKEQLAQAQQLFLKERRSAVLWNEGGKLSLQALPAAVQYSSVHAILIEDIDRDGIPDLLFGGNDYRVKPQFGRQDASKGCLCRGIAKEGKPQFETCQMLSIDGQIRSLLAIHKNQIIIGLNDEKIQWYEFR
ncbi:MAG: VCBS repeat-containing protein [Phaeodactylibacter sp.]|uniref:VCBS repeat-containing protein n=1 Tax=Phaeodactylibacter sp. TaxID=1940289 RepID=UPI0032F0698E